MKNEKNRSGKKAWNPILVLVLFLCAIFGLVALTYSWLSDSDDLVATDASDTEYASAQIDDFHYTVEYSFNGTDWNDASGNQNNGLYGVVVNYSNPNAPDYIGNLRYRVKQDGSMKSTVRVKFFYQWLKEEDSTALPSDRRAAQGSAITLIPNFVNTLWRMDQNSDGFYYYYDGSTYVFPRSANGADSYVDICHGFRTDPATVVSDAQLRIVAFVDGVQFNRYREVWEVSTVPTSIPPTTAAS